jgi:hypothetical protein
MGTMSPNLVTLVGAPKVRRMQASDGDNNNKGHSILFEQL